MKGMNPITFSEDSPVTKINGNPFCSFGVDTCWRTDGRTDRQTDKRAIFTLCVAFL